MINVREFTKNIINTESVQKAIDYAAEHKKVLYFPNGEYVVTSLALRDNSSIYLDKDAVIAASVDQDEWAKNPLKPVIICERVNNVSIRGKGTISASGYAFVNEEGYRINTNNRPEAVVAFKDSANITVENVTLKETLGWTLHLLRCDDVFIDGVIIRNPTYETRKNSDGIDINGCRNVTIMNCDIESGDDAICLKNVVHPTGGPRDVEEAACRDMYNINVYNCVLASTCNSTKIGTETVGNIYDVSFEKITVKKHPMVFRHGAGEPPYFSNHALSAISVQSNDGAVVRNISFKDYYVETVESPIFIFYQPRERFLPASDKGEVSNITIENLYVKKSYRNSQILSSHPGKIHDVKISGVYVKNYEEASVEYDPKIPTGTEYPDPYNFGRFPVFGLYSENAENLVIGEDVTFVDEAKTGRVDMEIK